MHSAGGLCPVHGPLSSTEIEHRGTRGYCLRDDSPGLHCYAMCTGPGADAALAALRERDELRDRLRAVCQTLVGVVGADGPTNAEDAAKKAVGVIDELRTELEKEELAHKIVYESCGEMIQRITAELTSAHEANEIDLGDKSELIVQVTELRAALEGVTSRVAAEECGCPGYCCWHRRDLPCADCAARKLLGWDK